MSTPSGTSAKIYIEHYFPKGYNPNGEPWRSIRLHHKQAIDAALAEQQPSATTPDVEQWVVSPSAFSAEYQNILRASNLTPIGIGIYGTQAERIVDAHNRALAQARG